MAEKYMLINLVLIQYLLSVLYYLESQNMFEDTFQKLKYTNTSFQQCLTLMTLLFYSTMTYIVVYSTKYFFKDQF